MSRLRIFAEREPGSVLLSTRDHAAMAAELATIGVGFEQWEATAPVAPGDSLRFRWAATAREPAGLDAGRAWRRTHP